MSIYLTKDKPTKVTCYCSGACGYEDNGTYACKHGKFAGGGEDKMLCTNEQHYRESIEKLKLELLYQEKPDGTKSR